MTIHVQNMVCARCTMLLAERLAQTVLPPAGVGLGTVSFKQPLSPAQLQNLDGILTSLGLARLEGRRAQIVSQIKAAALDWVQGGQAASPYTWSHYLSTRMAMEYGHLSHLFKEDTGRTLEAHLITLRTELAKSLLQDGSLTLTAVAERLGYSSLPHFSSQFKKETGLTPTTFRKHPTPLRPLDQL